MSGKAFKMFGKLSKKVAHKDSIPIRDYYNYFKISWNVQTRLFFENSTLHGVRYIAENGRPLIEKLMWFCCLVNGVIATTVIIISLWEKFQTNPTITGLDTDFHNWDVPFPAITVCPTSPGNKNTTDKEMNNILELLSSEFREQAIEQVTDISLHSLLKANEQLHNLVKMPNFPSSTNLKDLAFRSMNPCEAIFEECVWKTETCNCCDIFFPVFTEVGFCYTFNSKHYERNIPGRNETLPSFPIRYIQETDLKWSLKFTTLNTTDENNMAIYIHNSDEVPGIDLQPQHIWEHKVDRISFSVKQTYTTDDTRQLSIKQRRCIFENEIKLKINNMYTYTACTRQCRMEKSKKFCGCVLPFYPEVKGVFRHCSLVEIMNCYLGYNKQIESTDECACELGCSNTVYEVEKLNDGGKHQVSSSLELEFVSWPMVRYKREVLFGWVDLLVSFGGIAGLFLGFSLLSGVELIYYFTVRACCMVYKEKDELKKIHQKEISKPLSDYDLSLIPYFIRKPKKNDGLYTVAKLRYQKAFPSRIEPFDVRAKPKKMSDFTAVNSPFGIEFMH